MFVTLKIVNFVIECRTNALKPKCANPNSTSNFSWFKNYYHEKAGVPHHLGEVSRKSFEIESLMQFQKRFYSGQLQGKDLKVGLTLLFLEVIKSIKI